MIFSKRTPQFDLCFCVVHVYRWKRHLLQKQKDRETLRTSMIMRRRRYGSPVQKSVRKNLQTFDLFFCCRLVVVNTRLSLSCEETRDKNWILQCFLVYRVHHVSQVSKTTTRNKKKKKAASRKSERDITSSHISANPIPSDQFSSFLFLSF